MEWMLMPYRHYADFNGRSRRMEYWMFILFQVIVAFAFLFVAVAVLAGAGVFGATNGDGAMTILLAMPGFWLIAGLYGLFWLGSLVPSIAVTVRRLHDRDLSGWWYLGYWVAAMIPILNFVGGILFLIVMFLDGTRGHNRFGADPKDPASAEVFA